MAGRRPISKRIRFDVFKRDGFACVYCGAHPPDVILNVDHIHPVAAGGGNDIDNLLTACESCNRGKSARLLSSVPKSVQQKSAELAEREAQLAEYNKIIAEKHDRIEREAWIVADIFIEAWGETGIRRDWFSSIERFNERIGLDVTITAARAAVAKGFWSKDRCFRYFCGYCWNRSRD